jgi:hypothetical protein
MSKTVNNYQRYLQTYAGKKLLEKHDLEEVGHWRVLGEDPNCDWGGSHHQPYLTTMYGRLYDVLREAVELGGFWNWGSGREIIRTETVMAKTYPYEPIERPLTKVDKLMMSLTPEELKELRNKL